MYLFVFASNIQWEMAGPEEYSLVETSEERTLIKSTKLLCKIHKHTMLLSWFMAEKFLSDLAVDGDNVIIRSSSMRQSLTSPGLDAGRFRNTSTRLFAFCLPSLIRSMGHWSRMLSCSFSVRKCPKYWTREQISVWPHAARFWGIYFGSKILNKL